MMSGFFNIVYKLDFISIKVMSINNSRICGMLGSKFRKFCKCGSKSWDQECPESNRYNVYYVLEHLFYLFVPEKWILRALILVIFWLPISKVVDFVVELGVQTHNLMLSPI